MIVLWIFLSLLALALLLTGLYLLWFVRPCRKKQMPQALLCDYAHRGLHEGDIPENSLAAFAHACEYGFGIELDVQLSRDGVVMVFHDATLARMTGRDARVCELTCAELQALTLKETNEKIPTFSEVLALVDGRVPLLVELKGESTDTSLCEKVAELLRSYEGAYCIESFNPLLLRAMRKYLPDAYYGQLYTNVCRDKKKRSLLNLSLTAMLFNFLAKPDFIAYNQIDRNRLPVKITTQWYGAARFTWTVRTSEEYAAAQEMGACAIFEKNE